MARRSMRLGPLRRDQIPLETMTDGSGIRLQEEAVCRRTAEPRVDSPISPTPWYYCRASLLLRNVVTFQMLDSIMADAVLISQNRRIVFADPASVRLLEAANPDQLT